MGQNVNGRTPAATITRGCREALGEWVAADVALEKGRLVNAGTCRVIQYG